MRSLNNIFLRKEAKELPFIPVGGGHSSNNYPMRERRQHAEFIARQLEESFNESEANVATSSTRNGVYLEIKGQSGYDLITKSLEDVRQHVRLYNVRKIDDVVCATVFVPHNKKNFFLKKINKYRENETANPTVIDTIESIKSALLNALWIGKADQMPNVNPVWCEIWLLIETRDSKEIVKREFFDICNQLEIPHKNEFISFPERIVVGVLANRQKLEALQLASGKITEIRKMPEIISFFTEELSRREQNEWIYELRERINLEFSNTSVCLLDTGVNNGHPLLEDVLIDNNMHTVLDEVGVNDNEGHGTKMAGIVAFFNLEQVITGDNHIDITHFLESVKLIERGIETERELYGKITQQAVSLAEITNPNVNRTICMAVTTESDSLEDEGRPSSWSGAIDSLIAGSFEEELGSERVRRLMVISTGNTLIQEISDSEDYKIAITNHSVENPAQSWNAISVGAYTEKVFISDPLSSEYSPIAESGDISPFSSTSVGWKKIWPIKPDIVLEGGNLAVDNSFYSELDDLSLLTTNNNFLNTIPFTFTNMTSSATAQAAWIAAKLQHEFPDYWPETIRALIIHSAEWTETMIRKNLEGRTRANYRNLIRTCGYGVPNLDKIERSAKNSVNMIIQNELQPFYKKNTSVIAKEMHIHEMPWPVEILQALENTSVSMKVTLSYYVDPGPGEVGWKDKYQYPSCGLLFDVNNTNEDVDDFAKRINKAMREEAEEIITANDNDRWVIGINNRNVGSVHSDIWKGTASELSENRFIAVYPKTGWWKTRPHLKKFDSTVRYSLIVTIDTPASEADLYSEIVSKVEIEISV